MKKSTFYFLQNVQIMRININNEEGVQVKDIEEAVRVIQEKMLKFIKRRGPFGVV